MLAGLIPGPSKYSNPDTWLQPLVDELLSLGNGVETLDASSDELFELHAWAVIFSGDGPAVSEACGMKAPGNAKYPCRMCTFKGKYATRNRHYYYPHTKSQLQGHLISRDNLRRTIELAVTAGTASMDEHGTSSLRLYIALIL